ncbi:MAG: hypothetical protein ACAI25_02705, partial [Planctomycetota bacterium]
MPRRLIFNVELEEKLAGRPARLAPRFVRKLASRFLFLGGAEDVLEGDFELPAAFRARFPGLPGVSTRCARSTTRTLEWARSEPREVVRRVNSKAFAHEVAKKLGLDPPGSLCSSLADVEREVAQCCEGERWVLKRAFGHGGLGHFLGAGPSLPPNAPGWIEKALAPGEPIVFEPWVVRDADYSAVLEIDDVAVPKFVAVTELLTSPQGAYLGNRIGSVPAAVTAPVEEIACRVAGVLASEGYMGPIGIDAYSSGGALRPLVEINARFTMGRIALEIARREGRAIASWLTLPGPLALAPEGPHWKVTDPWPEEPGPATVFLWADSR